MFFQKLLVPQNFSRISRVSQSCLLGVVFVSQSQSFDLRKVKGLQVPRCLFILLRNEVFSSIDIN